MNWISSTMHATEVNDFLQRFYFSSDTLSIVHIDRWNVLVTLCGRDK